MKERLNEILKNHKVEDENLKDELLKLMESLKSSSKKKYEIKEIEGKKFRYCRYHQRYEIDSQFPSKGSGCKASLSHHMKLKKEYDDKKNELLDELWKKEKGDKKKIEELKERIDELEDRNNPNNFDYLRDYKNFKKFEKIYSLDENDKIIEDLIKG